MARRGEGDLPLSLRTGERDLLRSLGKDEGDLLRSLGGGERALRKGGERDRVGGKRSLTGGDTGRRERGGDLVGDIALGCLGGGDLPLGALGGVSSFLISRGEGSLASLGGVRPLLSLGGDRERAKRAGGDLGRGEGDRTRQVNESSGI